MVNILKDADECIHGERVLTYGDPNYTYPLIAEIASLITTKRFTTEDVCKIMIATKLVRDRYSPGNPDHLTDMCGYAGILADSRYQEVDLSGCAESQNLKAPLKKKEPSPAKCVDDSTVGAPIQPGYYSWTCPFCGDNSRLSTCIGYHVCPMCKAKLSLDVPPEVEWQMYESSWAPDPTQYCPVCGVGVGVSHRDYCRNLNGYSEYNPKQYDKLRCSREQGQHPSGGLVEDYEYNPKKVPDVPVNFDPTDDLF